MAMIEKMTGEQYERFLSVIARYIGTRKQFIRLDEVIPLSDGTEDVRVIYRGGFVYRFLVRDGEIMKSWREVKRA